MVTVMDEHVGPRPAEAVPRQELVGTQAVVQLEGTEHCCRAGQMQNGSFHASPSLALLNWAAHRRTDP